MARSYVQQGFQAQLTRDVATPDASVYLDKDWGVTLPAYLTIDPLNTPEVVLVNTVTDVGGGEFRYDVTRNQGPNNTLTHLTGQFVISAFTDPAFGDIWTDLANLANRGVVEVTPAMSPYTVQNTDQILVCPTTAGNITINLPSVATNRGRPILIQQFGGANTVTIDPLGGDGITNLDGNVVFLKTLNSPSALWAAYAHPNTPVWMTTGENGTIT